jgi:hypothetical protein
MAPSMKKAKRKEALVVLYIRRGQHEVRRRYWREAATRTWWWWRISLLVTKDGFPGTYGYVVSHHVNHVVLK